MTVTVTPELVGTVFYGRKVSDGNYGGTEAGIHVQFPCPMPTGNAEADGVAILAACKTAFEVARFKVEDVLGLDSTPPSHVIDTQAVATATAVFADPLPQPVPAASPTVAVPPVSALPSNPAVTSGPPFALKQRKGSPEAEANKQWFLAALNANPNGWYDNRVGKKNPNAPDFKNKTNGDWVIWL